MRASRGRALRLATSFAVVIVVAGIATPAGIAAAARSHAATPTAERWKGHDARARGTPVGVSARVADARIALAKSLGSQSVLQSDRTTGTLRFVGKLDGYLTGPSSSPA